jgi:hypothetical protein
MAYNCALCLKEGFHFHIVVENGRVKDFTIVSSDGSSVDVNRNDYTVGYLTTVKEE